MKIWTKFYHSAIPEYLARHYWWAYLWNVGVWFFDHQWIINSILFGKYKVLMNHCLHSMASQEPGRVLQLSCVYGQLTRHLYEMLDSDLHIADIADIQIKATIAKIPVAKSRCFYERMNAERLGFQDNCFDTVLLFFLFHELPPDARKRVLEESVRVLNNNGRLLIVDYGEAGNRHPFHKYRLFRFVLGYLEPFLPGFWRESLQQNVTMAVERQQRKIVGFDTELLFNGFYRVVEIHVE